MSVRGNEQVDRLASRANITTDPYLGTADMLRGTRNFQSKYRLELSNTDCLIKRREEKCRGLHIGSSVDKGN